MPRIEPWDNLPANVRQHLVDRWYKDFGSFKICGRGLYPKTFLLRGQPAKGEAPVARLDSVRRAPCSGATMTITTIARLLTIGLAVAVAAWPASLRTVDHHPASDATSVPKLMHTCLITKNVNQLIQFYEPILALKAQRSGEDYAEFSTPVGVLAIFSAAAQEKYIPGSAIPASNKSMILEFQVADVDKEYARLQSLVKTWVKPPTTQPWGTRSTYFRDPDGNLVDFYAPPESQ
jgi:catechol 2,3-dioxygenase-like lactoylglutathione lyase family enzyme